MSVYLIADGEYTNSIKPISFFCIFLILFITIIFLILEKTVWSLWLSIITESLSLDTSGKTNFFNNFTLFNDLKIGY